MKKVYLFLIFMIFMTMNGIRPMYATMSVLLRVGLEAQYRNVATIAVSNKEISAGYGDVNGFNKIATLRASFGFTAVPAGQYYVKLDEVFSDYTRAKQVADSYASAGFPAAPVLLGGSTVGIYIGGYNTQNEASAVNAQIPAVAQVLNQDNRRVVLQDGGHPVLVFENAASFGWISGVNGEQVVIKDRKYRGAVEFSRYSGQNLTLVNVLTLDEYLCSVVPSEMPSQWNMEAIKAQAIAGRSYTITRMGIHVDSGYDLCDGAHCQQYLGAGNESERTTQAVMETSGVMAYYDNQVINGVYFSSSGGVTADSETVWSNAIPYLRAVSDMYESTGKVWQRSFTLSEITELLNKSNSGIGSATGVRIGTSSGGRVDELIITGTSGSKTLIKEEIRNFFSTATGGVLESRLFAIGATPPQVSSSSFDTTSSLVYLRGYDASVSGGINGLYTISASGFPVLSSGGFTAAGNGTVQQYGVEQTIPVVTGGQVSSGDTVVFSGKGWGHGVGLSQHGANAMAGMGYTYQDILKYYYTGIMVY